MYGAVYKYFKFFLFALREKGEYQGRPQGGARGHVPPPEVSWGKLALIFWYVPLL